MQSQVLRPHGVGVPALQQRRAGIATPPNLPRPLSSGTPRHAVAMALGSLAGANPQLRSHAPLFPRQCLHSRRRRPRGARHSAVPVASAQQLLETVIGAQTWLTALMSNVEGMSPAYYGLYMLATSFGVPLSEDALVLWVGANVFSGVYGSGLGAVGMLAYLFALVVASDMVSFYLGRGLKHGAMSALKQRFLGGRAWLGEAEVAIARWSVWVGLVQRFTYGFPLCVAAGFLGVSAPRFLGGVVAGSAVTLVLQLGGAYLLRGKPGLVMTAIAACNMMEFGAPLAALGALGARRALGAWRSRRSAGAAAVAPVAAAGSCCGGSFDYPLPEVSSAATNLHELQPSMQP